MFKSMALSCGVLLHEFFCYCTDWRLNPLHDGRVCNNSHGLIRKYKLNICRRCFRQYAPDIGFKKLD